MPEVASGNDVVRSKTRVSCTDGFNRNRSVGLWTAPSSERVVLVAPPAEVALLSPTQARELAEHLVLMAGLVERHYAALGQLATRRRVG